MGVGRELVVALVGGQGLRHHFFFFSSRRRHTRYIGDWSSDVCSSDLLEMGGYVDPRAARRRIDEIFDRFPALADKRRHAARTLSGGQRQMLAMAMALMVEIGRASCRERVEGCGGGGAWRRKAWRVRMM